MRKSTENHVDDGARLVADAIRAGRLPKKPSPEQLARIAAVIRPVLATPKKSAA
jgi:hypothetical protein